jgi:histidinol-phosphate aminotransferase
MSPQTRIEQLIRPEVRAMQAYPVSDATGMVKLDVMESPYGLPEELKQPMAELAQRIGYNRYPVPTAPTLLPLMKEVFNVPPGCDMLLGNGSDECISIVTTATATDGGKILAPVPTFPMFNMAAINFRQQFVGVPLNADFTLDLERMLAAIKEHQPNVVWLAYPCNPTGNLFPAQAVEAILRASPGLVVVDEAYQPYAGGATFMPRLAEFDNLLVMRTVSKIGMAGMRLGYLCGQAAWIKEFDKVRPPFNVGVMTQAMVELMLRHKPLFDAQAAAVLAEREGVRAQLRGIAGVTEFPSATNFILARVPDGNKTYADLLQSKVLVKNFSNAHPLLANCLRLTIGTPSENHAMIEAIKKSLAP